ncbi:MAG TPA: hypothetical protein ENG52_04815 [Nitrososphaeria archaeon]|nr:hypothetical protein [Nitrososphaeria archaeon]
MSARIKPLHGHAFFTINYSGAFSQILVFDYYDPDRFYYSLLHDDEEYRSTMEELLASMNQLLSQEEIRVNGEKTEAEALTVNLDFRGEAEKPAITFYIEFDGKLKPGGENAYECSYEPGVAEYDYEVYWILPNGSRITSVETSTEYEIYGGRFLVMWARRGDRYSGYEKIVFILPSLGPRDKTPSSPHESSRSQGSL